ncbi:T9SS type A sorting domain-containing protein [Leptobacterium flavescens]|uniref:T9SS type A sorting domain-containing protein n=1 Tax=Leptobacterium flavescens TaxID=472055 RepID=A0A6P0UU94_9FLAO|nr:T9SS type A sorting domain-containing protein [Leptobacterium flavescens]NER13996.1 T9SS type A sorting domain-containing protein [Leptobacterium flavescens]
MKFRTLLFLTLLFITGVSAQNLHTDSNAASIDNEADATTGWFGLANLASDSSDPFDGEFALRASSSATNGRNINYSFNAEIGTTYVISIWAREGEQSFEPAFANWSGLDGFTNPTLIVGTEWQEYTFVVTATSENPLIGVFTSPSVGGAEGDTVFIDRVSITPQDNEAPSAVIDLSASNTTATSTDLSWSASTDDVGVTDYEVFQDGESIGMTGGATNFDVTGLDPETSYDFTVLAQDASGKVSDISNVLTVTTEAEEDNSCGPGRVAICYRGQTYCVPKFLAWFYVRYGASLGACDDDAEKPIVARARVYPNPARYNTYLLLRARKEATIGVNIYTRHGRLVYSEQANVEQGRNVIPLQISSFRRGLYILKITDAGIDQKSIRIFKL